MASLAGGPNLVWRDAWRYPGLRRATGELEQRLVRTGGGEMDRHPPGVAGDHGADLQQFQADGAGLALAILVPAKASRRIVSIKL